MKHLKHSLGASLNEPHTSGKFVIIVMYTNNYEKFPYLVGKIVHVTKDKQFTDVPYLIGTVVCVVKNNECILLTFHI